MNQTDNRELRIIKSFDCPIELMWELWTTPEHLARWRGPNGFTNTVHQMDLRDGGEWTMTLHGPDGKNYPNRSIFKKISPLRKIVYEHFNPHLLPPQFSTRKGRKPRLSGRCYLIPRKCATLL